MTDDHLGKPEDTLEFAKQMYIELDKHRNEKQGLKNWHFEDVRELVYDELLHRLKYIGEYPLSEREQIQKQCIHMANYLLMLYLKCKQNE